jgi:hypothetical protein
LPEVHGMPESGDKSGEFSMRKGSKERGGDDSCGQRCGRGSLCEKVRDERLVS